MTRTEAKRVLRKQYGLSSYAADEALSLAVVKGTHVFRHGAPALTYVRGSWAFDGE